VHDALYYSAREMLKHVSGRKALLLISDGEDTSSRQTVSSAIEMLQCADTIFYALNSGFGKGHKRHKAGRPQPSQLNRIALETGGQEFVIARTSLDKAFRQIEDELRSTYVIGYVSSNRLYDGNFRRIELRVNRPGLKVNARTGYRARRID
jgi:Ca-activated chloride channel family protein